MIKNLAKPVVQAAGCLLLIALLVLNSCSKSSEVPPPPTPTITSFTPASASEGASVIITGTNFSATAANNTVKFGDVAAPVTDATATSLTVTVPAGLSLGESYTLSAKVVANGKTSGTATSSTSFNYEFSGLVAYYKFAGDTKDYSGQGNDLTATDITYVNDHYGTANSAASFNGTTSKAVSSNGTDFNNSPSASVSIWFYGNASNGITVMQETVLHLLVYDGGSTTSISQCAGPCYSSFGNLVSRNTWHHIVGLNDGQGGKLTIYIDGVKVSEGTLGYSFNFNTSNWRFGWFYNNAPPGNFWQGYIGKTRIYNRVLTEAEITALYNE